MIVYVMSTWEIMGSLVDRTNRRRRSFQIALLLFRCRVRATHRTLPLVPNVVPRSSWSRVDINFHQLFSFSPIYLDRYPDV